MTLPILWTGDIFSTANSGTLGWLNYHMTKTPSGARPTREHFGVIGKAIYDQNRKFIDFETRESIGKGVASLRFFKQYMGKDIEIYRITDITIEEGIRSYDSISYIGDAKYGYIDYAEAIWDFLSLMVGSLFTVRPPFIANQLKVSQNDKYICTECAAYGPRQIGKPIESKGWENVWVIPVIYLQALEEGRLQLIYKGDLHDLFYFYKGDVSDGNL